MCEEYDILGKPMLPEFNTKNSKSPAEHLRQLCRDGWRQKIENNVLEFNIIL